MRINGNYEDVTTNALYGRRQAFTSLMPEKETGADTVPEKETPGVAYEKGSETSSKLYTSDGVKHNRASSGSRGNYSGQEILGEIERYNNTGQLYAIHNNGIETWLQGSESGKKMYFDPADVDDALGIHNPKRMSVKDNEVRFDNYSYYQFAGKDGKSHTVLSMGSSLSQGIFGALEKVSLTRKRRTMLSSGTVWQRVAITDWNKSTVRLKSGRNWRKRA